MLNFKKVNQLDRAHYNPIYSLAWNPNGKFFASASSDRTIKLWSQIGTKY